MNGRPPSSLSLNELSIIDTQNGVEKAKAREANNAPYNGVVARAIHRPLPAPSVPLIKPACVSLRTVEEWI